MVLDMRKKALVLFSAFLLLSVAACQLPTLTSSTTPAPGGPIASANITPNDPNFHGCPGRGDGGDTILNTFKNRTDEGTYVSVSLADLLALTWPQDIQRIPHGSWSASDEAAIARYEGAPVETMGYILDYKHEGTESTNCHASAYRDYHMWLAASPSDPRSQSMVIEITPRMQALRPGWVPSLSELKGAHVRIRGWLLFDEEHPEQLGQTRKTLWEIHPITHIEIDQGGGNWVSVDN
jgi:hypothetical protein